MKRLYYSIHDITVIYGISESSAYKLVRALPERMVTRVGRLWRVDISQFDEYMAEQH